MSILDGNDVRWHSAEHRPLRVRGSLGERVAVAGDDASANVLAFLRTHAADLRLPLDQSELREVRTTRTPSATVVRYEQWKDGLRVFDSYVTVQLDAGRRVRQVDLGHAAQIRPIPSHGDAALTADEAQAAARAVVGSAPLRTGGPAVEPVWFRTREGLRKAWRVFVLTASPLHDWELVLDAGSGEVLLRRDLIREVDRDGFVFDPNPVVTANDATLREPDATSGPCGFTGSPRATIDAQRVTRTLRDLEQVGTEVRLRGPYCRIVDSDTPTVAPLKSTSTTGFQLSSGDANFEDVNVYYHVDTAQRYIQSLGITNAHNSVIEADAHAGTGGASYSPADKRLRFGLSGGAMPEQCRPDRGQDGHVMLHEYGHAIQDDQVPGWGVTNPTTGRAEARAMGEGFGDIFATVFFSEHGGGFHRDAFEQWIYADSNGLRHVNGTKVYPTDWVGEEHDDGEIWSGALWNIYLGMGGSSGAQAKRLAARDDLLKCLILSHFRLNKDCSMPDGAEALMDENAENASFNGKHLVTMIDTFHARGILPCAATTDLWLKDFPSDPGGHDNTGQVFWDSPDLWIRNTDDNGTSHQSPEKGQDNWVYARVRNKGTAAARAFVVTFTIKLWAGTQFVYPADFIGSFNTATCGFNLGVGGETIVKARLPASALGGFAANAHACLLAAVYTPTESTPSGKHVWEHNNLAQKNLTIVDALPDAQFDVPFMMGNMANRAPALHRLEVWRPRGFESLGVSLLQRDRRIIDRWLQPHEIPIVTRPVTPAQPVIRLPTGSEIDIPHGGDPLRNIRVRVGPGSVLDLSPRTDEPRFSVADLTRVDAERLVIRGLVGGVSFRAGDRVGIPVGIPAHGMQPVTARIRVPANAQPGSTFTIQLVQRDEAGAVVGGISVQVRVGRR